MKKFILALCAAALAYSCSSDDDLPNMTFEETGKFLQNFGEIPCHYSHELTDESGTTTMKDTVTVYFEYNESINRIVFRSNGTYSDLSFEPSEVKVSGEKIEFSQNYSGTIETGSPALGEEVREINAKTTGYFKNKGDFHIKTEGEDTFYLDGVEYYNTKYTNNYKPD